jgi:N-acetyl-anhydromuramyl-L-alanine amidase AmpD
VDEQYKAWHAGKSYWKNDTALNNLSIGIEIDNDGKSPFSKTQITSCISLCKQLMIKYQLPPDHVIGHSDISPSRKIDPGYYFPWQQLAKDNIGIIPKYEVLASKELSHDILFDQQNYLPHQLFKLQQQLSLVGFHINETGIFDEATTYAIRAFLLHFIPEEIDIQKLSERMVLFMPEAKWSSLAQKRLESLL